MRKRGTNMLARNERTTQRAKTKGIQSATVVLRSERTEHKPQVTQIQYQSEKTGGKEDGNDEGRRDEDGRDEDGREEDG